MKKTERILNNLKRTLLQYMEGRRYDPIGSAALLKRLNIPPSLYDLGRKAIDELIKEKKIEQRKKQLWLKKITSEYLRGTLRVHPRGFGFVIPSSRIESPKDIFIPKHLMADAVDGDEVEVDIAPESLASEKGPEGKIVYIVKRGRKHLAGIIHDVGANDIAYVHAPLLGTSRTVTVKMEKKHALKVGDRIILQVKSWGKQNSPTIGEVCHHLGHISDPSIDVKAAVEEFDLHDEFCPESIEEASAFGSKIKSSDLKQREDLRDLECFTIDPTTAKDYDDALSLHRDSKGCYHLGVHIADVAHYVQESSHLDQEAYARCNSTYFPGKCVPMLPEELSTHLCSLRPNVMRLTVSVLMTFNKTGDLINAKFVRAVIKSKKRFTYEEAKSVIDGKKKSTHAPALKLMVELCLLLKKKRNERGSIDFALPDTVITVDKKGQPTGFSTVEYDISHQLVEEFMLKANETIATHFSKQGIPILFRVHEEPTQDNMDDFCTFARGLGFLIPKTPTKQDLQRLFDDAKNSPFLYQLTVAFIRSMKLATYSPDNAGHYGLALENYCHFTSPIRRYSDLVTQRLLFNEQPSDTNLNEIALKCSEQERISFRAEMSVKNLKKLRFLGNYYEEDPQRTYEACISRVKPFGLLFELLPMMIEGFLHISNLGNDYFIHDDRRGVLVGKHTGLTYKVGETILVRLVGIDFIVQESKWALAIKDQKKPRRRR
ncbi:MAG: ribonuclease R [Simkania sp.]|nr:ribonuclease R [Simkania sp.]